MTNKTTYPDWDEYQDISKALSQLVSKGYTKPMIKTVLEQMKEAKTTNEMTAEEAVKQINENCYFASISEKTKQALEMAIKALEQQTSEDCISRQAVIDHICESKECYKEECKGRTLKRCYDLQWVFDLPSVTPRTNLAETSQDCISREEVQNLINRWLSDYLLDETREALETINYKVGDMPPVKPKRPKGKWIEIEIDAGEFIYKCTKCGMRVINPYKYCPICGSYNGGGEE